VAVILPKQNRNAGTIDTGNVSVAGQVQPTTNYIFTALMDAADIADPTLVLRFILSLDAQVVRDETWTCGAKDRHGAFMAPSFSYSTGAFLPTTARGQVTLPKRISFGLDLTLGSVVQ
jgi:hypothetical protein